MPASITASDVMARAGALLNDPTQVKFTNTIQLPYLKMAFDELMENLEENNVSVTNEVSAALTIPVGTVLLTQSTSPAYPADLIDIQRISERTSGTVDDYLPMIRKEYLPETQTLTNELTWYTWMKQEIRFIGANAIRQIKIDYLGYTLTPIASASTPITLFQSINFLAARTAALCSEYIGNNPSRAEGLNAVAQPALDRLLNISAKGKQAMPVRRRPFRAAHKRRGIS